MKVSEAIQKANRSEVHRVTGISLSHVSKILGGTRNPSLRKLEAIASALGVPVDDLLKYLRTVRRRRSRRVA